MYWLNLFHIYQPPNQRKEVLEKVVKESYQKILKILEDRPRVKINLNICGSLTEQLASQGFLGIIERIKRLAERGQIELVGSAKYHPILPLLPKREVIRQIKLNEAINQKYFGRIWRPRPKGFFLPELAYHKKTARIIQQLGYQWIVLDEISYKGKLNKCPFDKIYNIKNLQLKVLFRQREISNLFFTGQAKNLKEFFDFIEKDKRLKEGYLLTVLDGENIGHHLKRSADLYSEILDYSGFKTEAISEFIKTFQGEIKEAEPLFSNWASREKELKNNVSYFLWENPKNKIHFFQWQLTNRVIKIVNSSQQDVNYKKARRILDQALFSCQYWWASACPWWSRWMVQQGAEALSRAVKSLKDIDKTKLESIVKLKNKIIKLAEEWETTDKVDQIKKAYLKNQKFPQWFSGKKVI